ncbi:MAG: hypothetical protein ACLRPV_04445 [Lacrimispora saccharolytica]
MYERYGLDKPVMERYLITNEQDAASVDFGQNPLCMPDRPSSGLYPRPASGVSARLGIQQVAAGRRGRPAACVYLAAVKRGTICRIIW